MTSRDPEATTAGEDSLYDYINGLLDPNPTPAEMTQAQREDSTRVANTHRMGRNAAGRPQMPETQVRPNPFSPQPARADNTRALGQQVDAPGLHADYRDPLQRALQGYRSFVTQARETPRDPGTWLRNIGPNLASWLPLPDDVGGLMNTAHGMVDYFKEPALQQDIGQQTAQYLQSRGAGGVATDIDNLARTHPLDAASFAGGDQAVGPAMSALRAATVDKLPPHLLAYAHLFTGGGRPLTLRDPETLATLQRIAERHLEKSGYGTPAVIDPERAALELHRPGPVHELIKDPLTESRFTMPGATFPIGYGEFATDARTQARTADRHMVDSYHADSGTDVLGSPERALDLSRAFGDAFLRVDPDARMAEVQDLYKFYPGSLGSGDQLTKQYGSADAIPTSALVDKVKEGLGRHWKNAQNITGPVTPRKTPNLLREFAQRLAPDATELGTNLASAAQKVGLAKPYRIGSARFPVSEETAARARSLMKRNGVAREDRLGGLMSEASQYNDMAEAARANGFTQYKSSRLNVNQYGRAVREWHNLGHYEGQPSHSWFQNEMEMERAREDRPDVMWTRAREEWLPQGTSTDAYIHRKAIRNAWSALRPSDKGPPNPSFVAHLDDYMRREGFTGHRELIDALSSWKDKGGEGLPSYKWYAHADKAMSEEPSSWMAHEGVVRYIKGRFKRVPR